MANRVTVKGQVTVPTAIRDHLKVGPGDRVEFAIVQDAVEVRKDDRDDRVREAIAAIQRRRPADGMSTDEYMALIRDEP